MDGAEASYPHQLGGLSQGQLDAHVRGHLTAGLLSDAPVSGAEKAERQGLCRFGAIDLDMPRDAATWPEMVELAAALQAAATELGLHTFASFSGRRGIHLWMPLATPMKWGQVLAALRVVCRRVSFTPEELWPVKGKCLKLPCGIHRASGAWSAVLPPLDSLTEEGRREIASTLEGLLEAAQRGEAVEPDWARQAELLAAAAPTPVESVLAAAGEGSAPDLDLLEDGAHPFCITSRLEQGPLPGESLNGENLLLAAYCHSRGLGPEEAEALATALFGKCPEGFTTKTLDGALRNFRSSLKGAEEERGGSYVFRCSNAVAGGPKDAKDLVASGRCAGEACPCWPWGPSPDVRGQGGQKESAVSASPYSGPTEEEMEIMAALAEAPNYGRLVWLALQSVQAKGLEPAPSLVLAEIEWFALQEDAGKKVDTWPSRSGSLVSLADRLAEEEFLAHLLTPGSGPLLGKIELSPAAFNATYPEAGAGPAHPPEPSRETYVQRLMALPPVPEDTWTAHLNRLADIALRVESGQVGGDLASAASDWETQPAEALATAAAQVASLQRAATPDLRPVDDQLDALVEELVAPSPPRVPVLHPGLAKVVGGGFRQGQLVVAGGPPGCGKTSAVHQWADEAAAAGVPTLFLSMEMGASQLWLASIARLSGVDSGTLAGGLKAGADHTEAVLGAVETYRATIAPHLWLVEGDPLRHTPARLAAMVGQIRHQLGKPPDCPALVVVDYLQLLEPTGKPDQNLPEAIKVAQLATGLKQLARATRATVVALSDVTKVAMDESRTGAEMGAGMFAQSGRILHAADLALAFYSGTIPARPGHPRKDGSFTQGTPAMNHLERALQEAGISSERKTLLERAQAPLKHPGDTYARWVIVKNRGGQPGGDVWSLYRRHLAQYLPCLPGEREEQEGQDYGF